jgi:tRNA uridine 5-carboxymethylaminomethyl modification enzyme
LDQGRYASPELATIELALIAHSPEVAFVATVIEQVEIASKYSGYIDRQKVEVERASHYENLRLPAELDYMQVTALSIEARQRLNKSRPETLGQASRMSGITPASISLLMIHLKKGNFRGFSERPVAA